jgi:hypothetical protein
MCSRYYRKSDKQKIGKSFHIRQVDDFPLPPWDYKPACCDPISSEVLRGTAIRGPNSAPPIQQCVS